MEDDIERLLMEAQRAKLTERRTEPRHAFVRPVRITLNADESFDGFSKDLSKQGIGVITSSEIAQGKMAVLTIHSTSHYPVHLKCELRWCDAFGKGWFLTGWKFLSSAAPPR